MSSRKSNSSEKTEGQSRPKRGVNGYGWLMKTHKGSYSNVQERSAALKKIWSNMSEKEKEQYYDQANRWNKEQGRNPVKKPEQKETKKKKRNE